MKNRTMAIAASMAAILALLLACNTDAGKAETGDSGANETARASDQSATGALTNEEAEALMKGLLKENAEVTFEISDIRKAPISGLWEVRATLQGEDVILYTDSDGKIVILPPQGIQVYMVEVDNGRVHTAEALSEMGKLDPSTMPLDGAIVYGPKEAKNRVVIFDDPF